MIVLEHTKSPRNIQTTSMCIVQVQIDTNAGTVCRRGLKITGLIKFLWLPAFTTESVLNWLFLYFSELCVFFLLLIVRGVQQLLEKFWLCVNFLVNIWYFWINLKQFATAPWKDSRSGLRLGWSSVILRLAWSWF